MSRLLQFCFQFFYICAPLRRLADHDDGRAMAL